MGKVFGKIISAGTFGLLGGDDDDDKKEPEPAKEETAKTDPVDQAQVDFNRSKMEAKARRSRIAGQTSLGRAPTAGLRVSVRGETNRTGVRVK